MQPTPDLWHTCKMTDTDKIRHTQNFGTDSAVIRIQIIPAIHLESQIIFSWNVGIGGGLRSLSALVKYMLIILFCIVIALESMHLFDWSSQVQSCIP